MKGTKTIMNSDSKRIQETLSEAEVLQLLDGLARQYEEVMQLSDFANYTGPSQDNYLRYSWDNPIGLVITGSSNASLV